MDFTPYFRTPLTDMAGSLINHQQHKTCRDFELRFMECMEAYGLPRGYRKCSDLFEDYHECAAQGKQNRRLVILSDERERQYKAGILKERYSPAPKEDSY